MRKLNLSVMHKGQHLPIIAILLIQISILLHFYYPISVFLPFPYNFAGIPSVIFGFVLIYWGKKKFHKIADKKNSFVPEGPFKLSRHPIYLGGVFCLAGIAALIGSVTAFVAPIAFFFITQCVFIPVEERIMHLAFGEEYEKYKRDVRKWV